MLALSPNFCMLKHKVLQTGLRLSLTTSVLQIGIEPPVSTTLDILKKGS